MMMFTYKILQLKLFKVKIYVYFVVLVKWKNKYSNYITFTLKIH